MKPDSLKHVIAFVEEKLGLKTNSISWIKWEGIIKKRMTICQVTNEIEYLRLLQHSASEWQEFVEEIVIPETWFFRDEKVFEFLPHYVKKLNNQNHVLRILCLACSTGEEPYSIAMTLLREGVSHEKFTIDAADISKKALLKAQNGVFGENSFRGQDLKYRDDNFSKTQVGYAVHNAIKKQVLFFYSDILNDNLVYPHSHYQMIFCRNLLIYLQKEAQMQILNQIKSLMAPNGILIVGSAEMQIAVYAGFVPLKYPHAFALQLKQNMT